MKVRKIVCLAMAAAMTLPLVACGDGDDNIKLGAGKNVGAYRRVFEIGLRYGSFR